MSVEDCPICGEEILLPYTLECKHRFCYLCIKRAYEDKRSCPYCRADIRADIAKSAHIVHTPKEEKSQETYMWLYAGANCGFWQYTSRHSEEIEKGYQEYCNKSGSTTINIYIMNRLYTIDFEKNQQLYTDSIIGRITRRTVRRVMSNRDGTPVDTTILIKGIAGLSWTTDSTVSLTVPPNQSHASGNDSSDDNSGDSESD